MTAIRFPLLLTTTALAVGFALAAAPAASQSTTSFTLEVPRKNAMGERPITRVKVVLSLSGEASVRFRITPPDGDPELLPTAGTLSPGSSLCAIDPESCSVEFCDAGDCTPEPGTFARDSARVVPPPADLPANDPGNRRYELWLDLLSDFDPNDPTDFCVNTMPVATESWTFEVDTGPGFSAACPLSFDLSCPGSECLPGCLNDPPLVTVGDVAEVTGFPNAAQACEESRPPIDVILALDKSGSMSGSPLGGTPPTKIDALHGAVTELVDTWEALRATEGAHAPAGDQIGLVFFDGNAHWMDDVGVGGWAAIPDGLGSFEARKDDIRDHIAGVSAGGSTSMGDGLVAAACALNDVGNAGNGHRKAILLMSNGKENTNARVKVDNPANPAVVQTYRSGNPMAPCPLADPDDACNPQDAQGPDGLCALPHQDSVQIYSVTVGTGTAVSADVNEDVARATGGGFYVNTEADADQIGPFFLELLQNFAKFNTWETVQLANGEVTPETPFTTRFFTGSSLERLILSLRWDAGRLDRVRLTLTPPGGGESFSAVGSGSIVMSPTLPLPPPNGEWTVTAEMLGTSPTAESVPSLDLRLTVLADTAAFRSELEVVQADYGPGDRIRLRARMLQSGRPVVDMGSLPGDQIRARLVRPGAGLGDLLSESSAPATQPQPSDPSSPADAKLANELEANPEGLVRDTDDIFLADDGSATSGDTVAGDGIYSGSFEARLPGHYDFLFGIERSDLKAGPFSRQKLQTVHVRSVPDPERTQVATNVVSGGDLSTLVITATPRTRFGNLLGPGFGPFFWALPRGASASAARPFADQLDGTYRAEVPFSGSVPPEVDIHFQHTSTNLDETVAPENLPEPLGHGTVLIGDVGGGDLDFRWSLSLHAGRNDPQADSAGDFWSGCEGDLSWGLDLEYRFDSTWAAELFYGHEDLECPGRGDHEVEHLSLNGKAYFLSGTWRPFLGLGIGSYDFSPGSSEIGFNLFGGLQANVTSRVALEATGRYHRVDADRGGNSVDADFFTYHLGARFRF